MEIEQRRVPGFLATIVVSLMALGTVIVFSAGADLDHPLEMGRFYDFPILRQMLFFPLSCLVMFTIAAIDYRKFSFSKGFLRSFTGYLLVISIILLVLVLIPKIGAEINQARRWIRIPIGSFVVSFQPSELAKWSMVIFLAAVAAYLNDDIRRYWKRFLPICFLIAIIVSLIVIEDFGTAAFIALVSFVILIIVGVKFWHLLTLIPVTVCLFVAALLTSPHRIKRIIAFFFPERLSDTAYQANQSLIAMGSGGIWGKGLGRGVSKYGHLPYDTTDFIFSIIGEELGFIGVMAVILLFILFVFLGFLVVYRCKDRFGRLLAAGIVLTLATQAALNIGVVSVVLPTKGIPLPFISAGGTSMLMSAIAVGILISIAKFSPINEEQALSEEKQNKSKIKITYTAAAPQY